MAVWRPTWRHYGAIVTRILPFAARYADGGATPTRFLLPIKTDASYGPLLDHLHVMGGLPPLAVGDIRGPVVFDDFDVCVARDMIVDPRLLQHPSTLEPARAMFDRLRRITRAGAGAEDAPAWGRGSPPVVLINKRTGRRAGRRSIAGVSRFVSAFQRAGFRVHHLDVTTVLMRERIRMLAKCAVFVGAQGAGMCNAAWLTPGAVAVDLCPWCIRISLFRNLSWVCGVHHLSVEACRPPTPAERPGGPRNDSSAEGTRSARFQSPITIADAGVAQVVDFAASNLGMLDTITGRPGRYRGQNVDT